MIDYNHILKTITGDAQVNMVKKQHLSDWEKILFGRNPIDLGLTVEKYQKKLATANPDVKKLLGDQWANSDDSFFHQTAPRALENQQAILSLVAALAALDKKGTMTYVNWQCGLGKTTCMLTLGHMLALGTRPPKGIDTVTVRLVLANPNLVSHYQRLFERKQAQADQRIAFEWMAIDKFK